MESTPTTPSDDFIRLLTSHQTQLRGLVAAALGHAADSQDVLQRTNLALWRKAGDYDPTRSFLAWAIGVARYEVLAFLRDRKRERLLFVPEVADLLVTEAEDLLPHIPARQAALRECLKGMPARNRELLIEKYVRGRSVNDLAASLGRSADGVKSLLLRVRRALEECITRRLARSGDL